MLKVCLSCLTKIGIIVFDELGGPSVLKRDDPDSARIRDRQPPKGGTPLLRFQRAFRRVHNTPVSPQLICKMGWVVRAIGRFFLRGSRSRSRRAEQKLAFAQSGSDVRRCAFDGQERIESEPRKTRSARNDLTERKRENEEWNGRDAPVVRFNHNDPNAPKRIDSTHW